MNVVEQVRAQILNERPIVEPGGVGTAIRKAATDIAFDAVIPGLGAFARFLNDLSGNRKSQLSRVEMEKILKAMSQNDSQRAQGWSKLDLDDNVFALLSKTSLEDIAWLVAYEMKKGVVDGKFRSPDDIPDGFANTIAHKYINKVLKGFKPGSNSR